MMNYYVMLMVMIIFFVNNYQFTIQFFPPPDKGHASGGEGSELAAAKIFVCHPRVGLGRKPRYSLFMENGSPLSPSVAAKAAAVTSSEKKKKKKKKKKRKQTKKLDAGTRVKQEKAVAESFTFYARFEEIVEDWKLQSDVGQRALVELASLLPSVPHMNEEFRNRTEDQRANYPTLANKIEDLFVISSQVCV